MAEDLYKEVRVISNPGSNKPLPRKATSKKTFSSIIEIAQLNKINDGELKEQGKERNLPFHLLFEERNAKRSQLGRGIHKLSRLIVIITSIIPRILSQVR